jgi:exodeoxyribonuclease V alpha subunit
MHPMTSADVFKLLESEGLPQSLQASVSQLFEAIQQGHTALQLPNEDADLWTKTLSESAIATLFAVNHGALQIRRHFAQELRVARALRNRSSHPPLTISIDPRQLMPHADASQQIAIVGAASQRLAIVTGGPGTGKTTTAAAIVAAKRTLFQRKPRVSLVAPTGKAAVRLTESFQAAISKMPTADLEGVVATTIHRQLNDLDSADIVLIDEASMVSLDLFDQLLKSLGEDAHLILMGDPNQLASVEAGSILKVIIESRALAGHWFQLNERHRIQGQEALAQLQDLCLLGDSDRFIEGLQDLGIFWESQQQVDRLEQALLEGYREYFNEIQRAVVPASPDFQCLTAISEGTGGRRMINHLAQVETQRLGLNGFGERLLVTENQPGIGVFNGDIGVVIDAHNSGNPRVQFDTIDQPLRKNQLGSVESAWAISIHRSQGSEYQSVLICLPEPVTVRSRFRPSRELLYTALTRAKESVQLFATEKMIIQAISRTSHRETCLDHFLNAS